MGGSAAPMTVLVTGGAGFIGSHFAELVAARGDRLIVLDALTYAGSLDNLAATSAHPEYVFARGSINDGRLVRGLLAEHRPAAIINFAAETHVDRSIDRPADFIETNLVGTYTLLEAAREYWAALPSPEAAGFRYLQVSTDEVYGSLDIGSAAEEDAYRPNSPYAASKAGGDHLIRAYHVTFGLPTLVTHGSNTYGPHQFPEKLIPVMILNAIEGDRLPVYGDGKNVRDWLFVRDHARAIAAVLDRGVPGETYNVGAGADLINLELVHTICDHLDLARPRRDGTSYRDQIAFVADRPGHDRRYSLSCSKIRDSLQWTVDTPLAEGIAETVNWYLDQDSWWQRIKSQGAPLQRIGLSQT